MGRCSSAGEAGLIYLCVHPSRVHVRALSSHAWGRTFSITSNSRMMYAFSRDGAIPGSKYLHKVDQRWRSPIRTGSSILSLPKLVSVEKFLFVLGRTSVARVCIEFHPRLAQSRQFGGLFRRHVHRHDRALHFLRYAIPNLSSPHSPPTMNLPQDCPSPCASSTPIGSHEVPSTSASSRSQ